MDDISFRIDSLSRRGARLYIIHFIIKYNQLSS